MPAPVSTKLEANNKPSAGGNSQKLKLFSLGKAISGAPIMIGINQLPNPPISIGITIKNIMIKACAVTITLYNWWFPNKIPLPGCINSKRISIDSTVPAVPEKAPNNR